MTEQEFQEYLKESGLDESQVDYLTGEVKKPIKLSWLDILFYIFVGWSR